MRLSSMIRLILSFLFCMNMLFPYAQDKVYLRDNSVVEGKVISLDDRNLTIEKEGNQVSLYTKNIVMVLFANGTTQVFNNNKTEMPVMKEGEWMMGVNILQPLSGVAGIMFEKNLSKRYSIRAGQAFELGYASRLSSSGLLSYTNISNVFYFGKKSIKWMNVIGLNLTYRENPYYYSYPHPYYDTFIMPYPTEGFTSYFDIGFTTATGIRIELSKHMCFQFQVGLTSYFDSNYFDIELDLVNSGFSFFYKF